MAVGPRARAQMLRMVAPETVRPESTQEEFYVMAWPEAGITPATDLAATLERHLPFPIRIEWGPYLLLAALQNHGAEVLVSGGTVPTGYAIPGNVHWGAVIGEGLQQGTIKLND